jgi:biotin operon repressor
MNNGWIKLHRKILEWEWYSDTNVMRVFLHLLLKANHKEKTWKGVVVPEGCLITGRRSLSRALGMSEQSVRTSLEKLKSTNELTIKSTNKYSLIQLNNWGMYQQSNQQTHQRTTTNNNVKKERKTIGENKFSQNNSKPMYKEPTIELDELGDPVYIKEPPTTFKKYPRMIASYYCELRGKRLGSAHLTAAKRMMEYARDEYPEDTMEQWYDEVVARINVAAKYYERIGSIRDWSLHRVADNWDIILNEWNI